GAVYRSIFFIIVSTGYWFLRQYLSQRKRAVQLETDRLEQIVKREKAEKNLLIARNAHLRAQVSPHLLFNVLTFIYRRVKKNDALAGEAIISLTSLMRYSVENNFGTEFVSISEEVEQVRDLENILKILKGGGFYFRMNIEEAVLKLSTVPLILLTLMENMYKHGDLSDPGNYGEIDVFILDGKIVFRTENAISGLGRPLGLGTGLVNLRSRLLDYYAGAAEMSYGEMNGKFEVFIKIPANAIDGKFTIGQVPQVLKE
uniref:sensor histidine kinase n=1 Tax=Pedobacter miscanthi TaxID=2259170 RepID=UPI002930BC98